MGITAINGVAITASQSTTAVSASTQLVTTNATHYFVFVDANNLTSAPEILGTVGNTTINPSTGLMQVPIITASQMTASNGLFGTSSWSTRSITASRAQTLETINVATNANYYPTFVDSANASTGTELVYTDGDYTYNPSTNELRAGIMNNSAANTFSVTTDANLTIDASLTQSVWWVASLTATRSLIVSNLTSGRSVRVYIRNTNATQRQITFSGSTSTTGHVGINMAISAGGASALTQNIAGSNGTMLVNMENFGGNIGGGVM